MNMYKFETKPVQGKLQICVSKETTTGSNSRLAGFQQVQKSRVFSPKPTSQKNDSDKLVVGRRPHTAPSTRIVNLGAADDDDGGQRNRKALRHRHRHSQQPRVGVTKAAIIIADCRSNQWKSVDDIRGDSRKKGQLIGADASEKYVQPRSSASVSASRTASNSNKKHANDKVNVAASSVGNCGTDNDVPEYVASVANSAKEFIGFSDETPIAWAIESNSDGSRGDNASRRSNSSLERTCTPTEEVGQAPKRMSLLEQKRLQWAAEKAQMDEWNPWGRPGGGAPHCQINQSNGINNQVPKSNYYNSSGGHMNEESYNMSRHGVTGGGRQLPPLAKKTPDENPTSIRILQAATFSAMGYIGDEALVRNCACDAFRGEHQHQWLTDFEQQKDEQRQTRLQDKSYYNKNLNNMNIVVEKGNDEAVAAESADILHFGGLPRPPSRSRTSLIANASCVPSTAISLEANNWNYNNASQRTFLRGANVPLDPETQNEMAKKRARALEHRKAIQSQLEDRLQQKRVEKDRQRREELDEELKMRQECERLEREYHQEQQKIKTKKISELELRESLKDKTQEATSKPIKRHHHHNLTSHLPDVLDGTKQIEITTIVPKEVDLKDCQEHLSKSPMIEHAPYVHNRVLTPTKYRDSHLLMRDFSTQTDLTTVATFPTRKNKGTVTRSRKDEWEADGGRQINRSNKGNRRAARNNNNNRESRPQWGANRPAQNYKTQSEKYLAGEASKMALTNQRKSSKEEKADDMPSLTNKPRLSGKKTRSSAEHQRKLFAQESVALGMQRDSRPTYSPFESTRPTATGSSEIGRNDTVDTTTDDQYQLTTRHQRRKWQSPSRQEVPNFYTDSPQLPDMRNVRRGTMSNNGRASKDGSSQPTGDQSGSSPDRSTTTTTTPSAIFRSNSPPVPALRNKLANLNMDVHAKLMVDGLVASAKDKKTILSDESRSVLPTRTTTITEGDFCSTSQETLRASSPPSHTDEMTMDHMQRRYTAPSCIQYTPTRKEDLGQRSEILNKLTLIRQGLFLKQREVEDLLVTTKSKDT